MLLILKNSNQRPCLIPYLPIPILPTFRPAHGGHEDGVLWVRKILPSCPLARIHPWSTYTTRRLHHLCLGTANKHRLIRDKLRVGLRMLERRNIDLIGLISRLCSCLCITSLIFEMLNLDCDFEFQLPDSDFRVLCLVLVLSCSSSSSSISSREWETELML
jgi:hypothetical protein